MCRGKRKRRSKVAIESKVVSSSKPVSDVQVQTRSVVTVQSMTDSMSINQSTLSKDLITTKAMDTPMETMTSTISGFDESFITNRLSDSKLPPLRGTVQEKQSLYNQKSKTTSEYHHLLFAIYSLAVCMPVYADAVQRYIDEVLAPTPVGQEPKLSQLAKTITWVAVLLLVLTEIFVSIKVGGMPFDLSGNGQLIKPPDTPAISIPTGPME